MLFDPLEEESELLSAEEVSMLAVRLSSGEEESDETEEVSEGAEDTAGVSPLQEARRVVSDSSSAIQSVYVRFIFRPILSIYNLKRKNGIKHDSVMGGI